MTDSRSSHSVDSSANTTQWSEGMTNKTDRKIAEEATPGPWQRNTDAIGDIFISGENGKYLFEIGAPEDAKAEADADFVTYFDPLKVIEMLDQLAAYEQRVAELEDALHKVIEDSELGIVPRSHLDKIKDLLK